MANKWTKFLGVLLLVAVFVATFLLKSQRPSFKAKIDVSESRNLRRNLKSIIKRRGQGITVSARQEKKKQICGEDWQKQYIKLHDEIVQSKRPSRFLIFDCGGANYGCGGYGNRLGAISSVLYLAVLTNRAFVIRWKSNVSLLDYLQPNNINWNIPRTRMDTLSSRHFFWGKGFQKRLFVKTKRFNSNKEFQNWFVQTDFENYFTYPLEIISSQWYFVSVMRKNKFFAERASELAPKRRGHRYSFIGCAIDFLFKMTPRLVNVLSTAHQYLKWKSQVLRIGIHFRAGDFSFRKPKQSSSRVFPALDKYLDCAERLERLINEVVPSLNTSSLQWFLATDNKQVKHYAKTKYPNKILSLDNKIEHISAKEPSRLGLEGVMLDNMLLSECDVLILSESTFSHVALGRGFHSSFVSTIGHKCIY